MNFYPGTGSKALPATLGGLSPSQLCTEWRSQSAQKVTGRGWTLWLFWLSF